VEYSLYGSKSDIWVLVGTAAVTGVFIHVKGWLYSSWIVMDPAYRWKIHDENDIIYSAPWL
jgi:hypothetical protein